MEIFMLLLGAYGLCFGFQNKATFLHNKNPFFDSMFQCSYCTGFHCGWITWISDILVKGELSFITIHQMTIFAFASAAFCFGMDEIIQYFESNKKMFDSDDSDEYVEAEE
jgi:hypothetical protein